MTTVPDYAIGSEVWPGLAKLAEECGELQQVIGKLMAYPKGDHPDGGGPLAPRLEAEIADVLAACEFVMLVGDVDWSMVNNRRGVKLMCFSRWHRERGKVV